MLQSDCIFSVQSDLALPKRYHIRAYLNSPLLISNQTRICTRKLLLELKKIGQSDCNVWPAIVLLIRKGFVCRSSFNILMQLGQPVTVSAYFSFTVTVLYTKIGPCDSGLKSWQHKSSKLRRQHYLLWPSNEHC